MARSLYALALVCAVIVEKMGRKADAIWELQTAVKMDPKLEPAQKDLKRLRAGS